MKTVKFVVFTEIAVDFYQIFVFFQDIFTLSSSLFSIWIPIYRAIFIKKVQDFGYENVSYVKFK